MPNAKRLSGAKNQALTRLVLETMGRECAVRLPGCTRVATTRDHIIPVAQGGTDSLANLRPACKSCNSKRGVRILGQRVHIITGPPAAGKSTYIKEHAGPADVVIDMDRIALAISCEGMDHHDYPYYIMEIARAMRAVAISHATRMKAKVHVWVIHTRPSPDRLAEYRGHGWEVVTIDPGMSVVMERAQRERPERVLPVIESWYAAQELAPITEASEQLTEPSRTW